MRFLIALSLAALSLSASTMDARAPRIDREWVAAICDGDGLPFALPSAAVTEDWADSEFETWADREWSAYCGKASTVEARAVCACTGH